MSYKSEIQNRRRINLFVQSFLKLVLLHAAQESLTSSFSTCLALHASLTHLSGDFLCFTASVNKLNKALSYLEEVTIRNIRSEPHIKLERCISWDSSLSWSDLEWIINGLAVGRIDNL